LVGTYDGANTWLYVNGAGYSSSVTGFFANYDDGVNVAGPFTIGARSSLDNDLSVSVDEAVFYNHALTANEVAAHYSDRSWLTPSFSGGNHTLTWPAGTLQQADEVTGPYTDVSGAMSPYTITPAEAKKFYRLKM
jgi:hypothetical protein